MDHGVIDFSRVNTINIAIKCGTKNNTLPSCVGMIRNVYREITRCTVLQEKFVHFTKKLDDSDKILEANLKDCEIKKILDCSDNFNILYLVKAINLTSKNWRSDYLRIADALICFNKGEPFFGTHFIQQISRR